TFTCILHPLSIQYFPPFLFPVSPIMGNHLSQIKPPLSKRNSLPSSSFSPLRPTSSLPPPSSRLSCHHLPYQNSGDGDEEPINERFVSRLKDIDGEVKNSRDKGINTIGLDKLNVGFVGFCGSGRTTLIRSILGCPLSLNDKGGTIIDKRSTFQKSRSVHFSETFSSQLVPFYFRHLTSIVLWEISYPFDALVSTGEQETRMERREEKLRTFFVDQHLSKFCLLFVCVDGNEPREEDIAFARAARLHGKEVIFLKTKSDSLVSSISTQEEASSVLNREKNIFESKLAATAQDLCGMKTFFVSSRAIPTLISESSDERIIAFRQLELLPSRLTQSVIEGRRHTMEGSTIDNEREEEAINVIRLEEESLMRFILDQLDELPLTGRSF
ncbi:hypothetical protein PENTCL1PPCAC_11227, partial [Pristionchus entomophagus]